jgi:metal-responsive CopG/Arc/MetJ family transcriptional regulator
MAQAHTHVVTFKADDALLEALNGVSNRSEFIRSAIVAALDGACPLCKGTGILTPAQREHWDQFAETHRISECDKCHELHLVCFEHEKEGR